MPRIRHIDRPYKLHLTIPTSVMTKVQLELHSEVECRVPYGAMGQLVTRLLSEWLESERGVRL